MTEENILAGNFLFVSYSHRDMDGVREDVRALQAMGARVWFDENMRVSDNWKDIAREKISHPNCKGVIFYNSKSAFLSDAVSLERREASERKKAEGDFGIYSVNLGGKSMQDIYAETLAVAPLGFLERMQRELLPLFNDEILYIPRLGSADCAGQIFEKIIRPKLAVDDAGLFKDAFEGFREAEKRDRIRFGSYFGAPCAAPLKHSAPNERFVANGTEYLSRNNELFGLRPLEWDLLYAENAAAVLLCSEIVDVACGGEGAESYLKEIFLPLAFSGKERGLLRADPRLLTPADIAKAKEIFPPDGNSRRHWWVNAPGLEEHWQMTCCGTALYSNGFNVTMKKGIRPVIEFPLDKLK